MGQTDARITVETPTQKWKLRLGRNKNTRLEVEEKAADKKLSTIALRKGINRKATS